MGNQSGIFDSIDLLLPKGGDVAVALSGGPDSMALCWLLAQASKQPVHALIVDHALRPESAREAKQVAARVKDWPHIITKIIKRKPTFGKSRVMESARHDRYELLADYCGKKKINVLYVAHHQDDQAETFLFRLAKGSGLDGLAGMKKQQPYSDKLTLLRPLLGVPKTDLIALCENNDIPFVRDPTNENEKYARSRLRAARTVLEAEGLSSKRLAVTASRFLRARTALDFYATRALAMAQRPSEPGKITLDYATLEAEPCETRLRVFIHLMEGDDDGYGPRRSKLEDLVAEMFEPGLPFRKRTLGGFILSCNRRKGLIFLERERGCLLGQRG